MRTDTLPTSPIFFERKAIYLFEKSRISGMHADMQLVNIDIAQRPNFNNYRLL